MGRFRVSSSGETLIDDVLGSIPAVRGYQRESDLGLIECYTMTCKPLRHQLQPTQLPILPQRASSDCTPLNLRWQIELRRRHLRMLLV